MVFLAISAPAWSGVTDFCFQVDLPIPDGGQVVSEVGIDAGDKCPPIGDLNVVLDIAHTRVGDLRVSLGYDFGAGNPHTEVVLDRPGVPGNPAGCEGDDILATIDDEAVLDAESMCLASSPAISGSVIGGDPPDAELLTAFDGDSPCGSWVLTVEDLAEGDAGNLNEWCIQVVIAADEPVPATGHPAIAALVVLMLASVGLLVRRAS